MINCMIIYVYDNDDDDNDDDEGKYILCPWTVSCVRFDIHKWERGRDRMYCRYNEYLKTYILLNVFNTVEWTSNVLLCVY